MANGLAKLSHLKDCLNAEKQFTSGLIVELAEAVSGALEEMDDAKADKSERISITIQPSGWTTGGGIAEYPYCYEILAEGVTENDLAIITIAPQSQEEASACGLWLTNETDAGKIKIWAKRVPQSEIHADYLIFQGGALLYVGQMGSVPDGGDNAQPDWNDIKNRPFGEEPYAVTWDGTPTGEPVTLGDLPWYKISDALPDPESVKDASVSIETAGAGTIRFSANPVLAGGLLRFMCSVPPLGDMYSVFIAYDGNGEGFSPGMYCVDSSVASTLLGVTITSATAEWVSVKTIDPKYLPDALQCGIKPSDTITIDEDGTAHVNMDGISAYFAEILEEVRNGSY